MTFLTKLDGFSRGITLTHNKKTTYGSQCGGCITILCLLLVLGYLAILIMMPMELTKTTVQSEDDGTVNIGGIDFQVDTDFRVYEQHTSRYYDDTIFDLTVNGYSFAVLFNTAVNPQYFYVDFYIFGIDETGNLAQIYVPAVSCNETNFPTELFDDQDFSNLLSSMICPDTTTSDLVLKGDTLSNSFYSIVMQVIKCTIDCASETDMNTVISNVQFAIASLDSYYDAKDSNDSIKKFLKYTGTNFLEVDRLKYAETQIVPTRIKFLNGRTATTYSMEEPPASSTSPVFDYLLAYYSFIIGSKEYLIEEIELYTPVIDEGRMLADETVTEEEKKNDSIVYQIFFFMAQIGGFYSFLNLIFGCWIHKIYESMLIIDLINKFNAKNFKIDSMKDSQVNPKHNEIHEEEKRSGGDNSQDIDEMSKLKSKKSVKSKYNLNTQTNKSNYRKVDASQDENCDKSMQDNNFGIQDEGYKYREVFKLGLLCCKKKKTEDDMESQEFEKYQKFEEDLKKFYINTDIINVVTSIKDTKQAINSIIKSIVELQDAVRRVDNSNGKQVLGSDDYKAHGITPNLDGLHRSMKTFDTEKAQLATKATIKSKPVNKTSKKVEEQPSFSQNEGVKKGVETKQPVQNINSIIESEINALINSSKNDNLNEKNINQMVHCSNPSGTVDIHALPAPIHQKEEVEKGGDHGNSNGLAAPKVDSFDFDQLSQELNSYNH